MLAARILRKAAKKRSNAAIVPSTRPTFLIVAAIGNPDRQYDGTRHNAGKMALSMTSMKFFNHPKLSDILYALDMERPNMLFLKTDQYMNLSGVALKPALKFFTELKKEKYNIQYLIIHDELSKDIGKVQLRGSDTSVRGHNGLKNIDKVCNIGFLRLGIGIGRPDSRDPSDVVNHVLGVTTRNEREIIRDQSAPKMMEILDTLVKTKIPENRDIIGGPVELKPPIQGDEKLKFQDPDPEQLGPAKKDHEYLVREDEDAIIKKALERKKPSSILQKLKGLSV